MLQKWSNPPPRRYFNVLKKFENIEFWQKLQIRNKIQPPSPAEIAAKDERRARRKRCQQWVESGRYVAGDVVGDSQDIEDVTN